jgi:hypothetical protein
VRFPSYAANPGDYSCDPDYVSQLLSPGAIAGIVVLVIVALLLLALGIYKCAQWRKLRKAETYIPFSDVPLVTRPAERSQQANQSRPFGITRV